MGTLCLRLPPELTEAQKVSLFTLLLPTHPSLAHIFLVQRQKRPLTLLCYLDRRLQTLHCVSDKP